MDSRTASASTCVGEREREREKEREKKRKTDRARKGEAKASLSLFGINGLSRYSLGDLNTFFPLNLKEFPFKFKFHLLTDHLL